jgi:hypothetical protein
MSTWRILDSRVVIGQVWRNRLFLQTFPGGCDRCGIFGKSHLISSAEVLYRVCKTPRIQHDPSEYRKLIERMGSSNITLSSISHLVRGSSSEVSVRWSLATVVTCLVTHSGGAQV